MARPPDAASAADRSAAAADEDERARSLLVRLPNWVGDVCMALPALRELEARGLAPVLVGRGWAQDLLAGHPWPVTRWPASTGEAIRTLRASGVRRGLLFTNSFGSAWSFRRAGVSAVGHRNEGRSLLLGRAIAREPGRHEVEVFWRLAGHAAARAGCDGWPASPPGSLGLRLAHAHRDTADAALAAAGLGGGARYAVLAPLAAGTIDGASKSWDGFATLGDAFAAHGIATVCCPGPGEEAAAREALPRSAMLTGLALGAYAAVCAGACVTVANDSGPMHLAAAVDAPVVGVFGPSDPDRTHPWGAHARWAGGRGRWPDVKAVVATALAAAARNV